MRKCNLSKSHRSCSHDKLKEKFSTDSGQFHTKHQSPVVDRWILEELKTSNLIAKQSSPIMIKAVKSKGKVASPKILFGGTESVVERDSVKHNKSSKYNHFSASNTKLPKSLQADTANKHIGNLHSAAVHTFTESILSKKSTEFQTNTSPRDTKTDDSKLETSTDKDKVTELENEVLFLKEQNKKLINENISLRTILKDYEQMKTNENILLEKLESATIKEQNYEVKLDEFNQHCTQLSQKLAKFQEEIQNLTKENKRFKNESEINANHQETKIRLLKEALNKRNEDIKQIEETNDDLIKLLQKCDEKLLKLDEDYRFERMKNEKYEKQFTLTVKKLDSSFE